MFSLGWQLSKMYTQTCSLPWHSAFAKCKSKQKQTVRNMHNAEGLGCLFNARKWWHHEKQPIVTTIACRAKGAVYLQLVRIWNASVKQWQIFFSVARVCILEIFFLSRSYSHLMTLASLNLFHSIWSLWLNKNSVYESNLPSKMNCWWKILNLLEN